MEQNSYKDGKHQKARGKKLWIFFAICSLLLLGILGWFICRDLPIRLYYMWLSYPV